MTGPAALSYRAELFRKALHLASLSVPGAMAWLEMPFVWYALLPAALLATAADVARAHLPAFNRFIRRVFGPLMRASELPPADGSLRINGATWVLVAAALLGVAFPLRVVVPVLAMSLVADAAAALIGRRYGRHPWGAGTHTVEGSLAFVAAGCGVLAGFPGLTLPARGAAVLVAAAVEALPLPLNDNLCVPLAAALAVRAVEQFGLG